MKCVVVGGSGFIGSHVVQSLKKGGHEVTNIDLVETPFADRHFKLDLRDPEALTPVFERYGKDGVFHVAAIADARRALENPLETVDINIRGTAASLEACRRAQVSRFFLSSTVWVYNAVDQSHGTGDLTEDEPIRMEGGGHVYTTSKITSELLCHDFHRLYGLNFTIFRYGIPYGPRMWPGLALRTFLDNGFSGKPIKIFGDGSAMRRFVFVEDLAQAHVLALHKEEAKGQTYNLEGDVPVTIKDLAETVAFFVKDVKIEYVIDPSRRGEMKVERKISNSKAKRELGWKMDIPLKEGVGRVVDWYKKEFGHG